MVGGGWVVVSQKPEMWWAARTRGVARARQVLLVCKHEEEGILQLLLLDEAM